MNYAEIKDIINETFPTYLKNKTLDFVSYLHNNSMVFERLFGYWKNQFYYAVKYKNESVFYILLSGTGEEKEFAPLTIWTDDSGSNCYENSDFPAEFKECAYKNIDYCIHCGSCDGGKQKIVFGKGFDNVCRTVMRFTNPTDNEFDLLKVLANIRKNSIK